MTDTIDEMLAHWGIKGMRWGVRRSSSELAVASGRKAKKESSDKKSKKEKTSTKSTNPGKLSDSELKAAVSRMQMEKQYRELSGANNKTKTSTGKKFVAGIANNIAKTSIQTLGQSYANQSLGPYMAGGSKALNVKKSARIPPPPPFKSPFAPPKIGK